MIREKNFSLKGKHGKPIVTDVYYAANQKPKPIVIFCHGYKGFKDWGAWNLVAEEFAAEHIFFIKFNFSHNGGTPEQPVDFPDLEAFANDNYSKQLDDLESVIDWISITKEFAKEADVNQINLIGHSRGGGIVLLKTIQNNKIKKVITWAGVDDFGSRFPSGEKLKEWKEKGVYYVENGRTKQQMPHYYQFFEDFKAHEKQLSIKNALKKLSVPQLIIHAKEDPSVSVKAAQQLHQWNPKSVLYLLEKGNHVFGANHPWEKENMPPQLKKVTEKTISFIKK